MLDRAFGQSLELEENAALSLAGGILGRGYQCGMTWGAALAAGAEAYRRHGSGPEAEAATIQATRKVVETFRTRHGEINCREITGLDKSSSVWKQINAFLLKGIAIRCFRLAGWYAPLAYDAIDSALDEDPAGVPPPPLSCASLLARTMGESDRHAVMASGLAGGIGLCGEACGALGAAIWILGMRIGREEEGKMEYKDPRIQELIDRFSKHTGDRFGCSDIAGRSFEDVAHHADYLRTGGCRELIELLAAHASDSKAQDQAQE